MKIPKYMLNWHPSLRAFFTSERGTLLIENILHAYEHGITYPSERDIFKAYELTCFKDVRVIILGQDPYHKYGQAHGLAFSVPDGIALPPSLRNIFKEIYNDESLPSSGDLSYLSDQGVLLINTHLTVPHGQALGHSNIGWQALTEVVIRSLSEDKKHLVFLLWGAHAQSYIPWIKNAQHHLILTAPHPSPLSAHRGFVGCNHFELANEYLRKYGSKEIDWKRGNR